MSLAPIVSSTALGVQLSNVHKVFASPGQRTEVLHNIDLRVEPGEFVSVLGPSGSGKSTLLNIVAGLERDFSGEVTIGGAPVQQAAKQKLLALVPQAAALLPWRTVLDNVRLPLRVNRAGHQGRKLFDPQALLSEFGLEHALHRYPAQLSGGMQQRVALARAFVFNPAVLLMDEPFSALDELNRDQQRLALLNFWHSNRKTVIFVTHSVPEAIVLSDRIVILAGGSGTPGRIAAVVPVHLSRPRTADSYAGDDFRDLEGHIRDILRREGADGREKLC